MYNVQVLKEKSEKVKPQSYNELQHACSPTEGENDAQHVAHKWMDRH